MCRLVIQTAAFFLIAFARRMYHRRRTTPCVLLPRTPIPPVHFQIHRYILSGWTDTTIGLKTGHSPEFIAAYRRRHFTS